MKPEMKLINYFYNNFDIEKKDGIHWHNNMVAEAVTSRPMTKVNMDNMNRLRYGLALRFGI